MPNFSNINCRNCSGNKNDLCFHCVPTENLRKTRSEWLHKIKCRHRLLTYHSFFICPDHFEEDCFEWDLTVGNNFAYFTRIVFNNYLKIFLLRYKKVFTRKLEKTWLMFQFYGANSWEQRRRINWNWILYEHSFFRSRPKQKRQSSIKRSEVAAKKQVVSYMFRRNHGYQNMWKILVNEFIFSKCTGRHSNSVTWIVQWFWPFVLSSYLQLWTICVSNSLPFP